MTSNTNLPTNVIGLLEGFLLVAETLNISQAARALKISRVTLQNRLRLLEELCGYPLLELDNNNRYKLTARAENWAQEVRVWLLQGEDLFSLSDERASGLLQSVPEEAEDAYYSQQHPVSTLWEHNVPYLRSMFEDWVKAKAQYDNPALNRVRENAVLARLNEGEFIIMEIGKNAAIMDWLGRDWCLSAIGNPLPSTAISTKADQVLTYAYRQVIRQGAPWYDHVSMEMPRPVKNTRERAYYRRLILPCKLPDGSPVVASVVELSDKLVIGDLEVPRKNQPTRES